MGKRVTANQLMTELLKDLDDETLFPDITDRYAFKCGYLTSLLSVILEDSAAARRVVKSNLAYVHNRRFYD